jgi:hypothetical protein
MHPLCRCRENRRGVYDTARLGETLDVTRVSRGGPSDDKYHFVRLSIRHLGL